MLGTCELFRSNGVVATPLSKKECNALDKEWRDAFLGPHYQILPGKNQQLSVLLTNVYRGAVFLPEAEEIYRQIRTTERLTYVYAARGPSHEAVHIDDQRLLSFQDFKRLPRANDACLFPLPMDWCLLSMSDVWSPLRELCFIRRGELELN